MAKVNKVFPSPYNGISEQIPELMLDNQCIDMVNCIPDLVLGLTKRPPALWLTRIPGLSTGTGVEIGLTGWYRMTLESDTYASYDVSTLTYYGGVYLRENPSNHTVNEATHELQTTGAYSEEGYPYHKSHVVGGTRFEVDRNASDTSADGEYRCKLEWDSATRTWTRIDNVDYWLYSVNEFGRNSHSWGVSTNDPRFLVDVVDDEGEYDKAGLYPDYPKSGYIWLFAGETI